MTENATTTEPLRVNPFFEDYATPFNTVPFDKIQLSDFEEAFLEGIRRDDEEIALITSNPEPPTFDNTIIFKDASKGEHYYDLLDRVSNVFSCLMSAETSPEMEALAQKLSPVLTKHANDVSLNPKLFLRVKAVYENHRFLTPEEQRLLENCYEGFVRSGALLDEEGKARLRQLSEEAALLTLQFSQNLLKENKAFALNLADEADLDGLPETALQAAAATARERGEEGWTFTLDSPSMNPFLTYSTRRELRQKLYMEKNTLCIKDNDANNLAICQRLVNIRRETAQLLGFETFADYVLKRRMASDTPTVYRLLHQLIEAYKPAAERERRELEERFKEENPTEEFAQWDSAFISHKLRKERYNIDAEMLRPYFKLENVIKGVFALATTLYGISFREREDIPVYHPDVKAYEVSDRDGSHLAVLYADFFPRDGKRSGAWMTEFRGQHIDRRGVNVRPHVSLVMNFTKPTPERPALLTLGEVETFLHEFGHALHGMFANTRFGALSGTNVWWDFVELPSQFMENYAVEKEFLQTFAFHYQTGEVMPEEMIERIVESRNFGAATACLRQVSFGLLDMAYYTQREEFTDDVIAFEKQAWQEAMIAPQRPDTCMTAQFSHIMAGGYSAGYYSYKWAEVLDADAFDVFKKTGIFNEETAWRFRDCILSKGGTEHPMTLYKRFKGSEPTIDALLRRNGITTTQKQ